MAKLFDQDGNEVEAFTKDELEAQKKAALDQYLKDNPDKSGEFTKLQTQVTDLTTKLAEAEKNGMNEHQKNRLKADKEAAEAAVKDLKENFTRQITELKDTFFGSTKAKIVKALTKGDKDLTDKLELKAKSLTGYPDTEEGIAQKYQDAFILATGNKPAPNFMDNMGGAGDKGNSQQHNSATPETDNSKAMRAAFGITDKDAEKYKKS